MRKYLVIIILILITILFNVNVYASAYPVGMPQNENNRQYITITHNLVNKWQEYEAYHVWYTTEPLKVWDDDVFNDGTNIMTLDTYDRVSLIGCDYAVCIDNIWGDLQSSETRNMSDNVSEIVYANYTIPGYYTFRSINNTSIQDSGIYNDYKGITFDYEGFLGKLGIKLYVNKDSIGSVGGGGASGGAGSSGTYGEPIQEWEYPEGQGTVNISDDDISYYNSAEYKLEIYDGDTITNTYYYIVNTNEKLPYCNINYPVAGAKYDYFPNINIQYYDMGELNIYINQVLYKHISTKDKEGIEVIEGTNNLFSIGLNTVYVEDINSQTVATVQYQVMREGTDPNVNLPEFDAESWVQKLFNNIMDEYSLFFTYVQGIYSFLPYEIVGLVVIILMLSVVLWVTGRK